MCRTRVSRCEMGFSWLLALLLLVLVPSPSQSRCASVQSRPGAADKGKTTKAKCRKKAEKKPDADAGKSSAGKKVTKARTGGHHWRTALQTRGQR